MTRAAPARVPRTSNAAAGLRVATRPFRRAVRAISTADPDRSRLRQAATAIATIVLVGLLALPAAAALGAPATAAVPAVVLAMIASTAVREPRAVPRSITILLLAPAATASIALASALSGNLLVADAVFVGVAVVAVLLRLLGPRGLAIGLIAFMSYFLALFVRITPAELPVTAGAELLAAVLAALLRVATASRHPERDVRRMIGALGYRCSRVCSALGEVAARGGVDDRLRRALRSRVQATASTASAVVDVIGGADRPIGDGVDDEAFAVRVIDLELAVERLVEVVADPTVPERRPDRVLAAALDRLAADFARPGSSSPDAAADAQSGGAAAAAVAATHRVWRDVAEDGRLIGRDRARPAADREAAPTGEAHDDDHEQDAAPEPLGQRFRDVGRQAVQVGIAAALAIAAGTALSSTRWFWAAIAAFVVYTGTASRGDILRKGWQRVVGTLVGVVVGVVVAALVGGNTVVAVVLIVVCLFLAVYLMSVSSAFMTFFITTMLALLYGLLGEFSIDLLLTRLTETAAGAVIGVGVASVVLPSSTRDLARSRLRDLLGLLADDVGTAVDRFGPDAPPRDGADELARLRELGRSFQDFRDAAQPISDGFAGVTDRSGTRRTVRMIAACEYHCRALLRRSDVARGIAPPEVAALLTEAARIVRGNFDALADALGSDPAAIEMRPADEPLDRLESRPELDRAPRADVLRAAARDLRAMDRAVRSRMAELGAAVDG